jgi:hypothetical protein
LDRSTLARGLDAAQLSRIATPTAGSNVPIGRRRRVRVTQVTVGAGAAAAGFVDFGYAERLGYPRPVVDRESGGGRP